MGEVCSKIPQLHEMEIGGSTKAIVHHKMFTGCEKQSFIAFQANYLSLFEVVTKEMLFSTTSHVSSKTTFTLPICTYLAS